MQLDKSDLKRPLVSVSAKSFLGGHQNPKGRVTSVTSVRPQSQSQGSGPCLCRPWQNAGFLFSPFASNAVIPEKHLPDNSGILSFGLLNTKEEIGVI